MKALTLSHKVKKNQVKFQSLSYMISYEHVKSLQLKYVSNTYNML